MRLNIVSPLDTLLHGCCNKHLAMFKLQIVDSLALATSVIFMLFAATEPLEYYDKMSILCTVGGIAGAAFLAVMWPPKGSNAHQTALGMFLANGIAGYLWGPMLTEWWLTGREWSLNGRNVIGTSAIVACIVTGLLRPLGPVIVTRLQSWISTADITEFIYRVFRLQPVDRVQQPMISPFAPPERKDNEPPPRME